MGKNNGQLQLLLLQALLKEPSHHVVGRPPAPLPESQYTPALAENQASQPNKGPC